MAFAKGVVHFGQDAAQRAVLVVAVEVGDRIEAVAQVAQVGEQEDGPLRESQAMLEGIQAEPLPQGQGGVAEMVLLAEAGPIPPPTCRP